MAVELPAASPVLLFKLSSLVSGISGGADLARLRLLGGEGGCFCLVWFGFFTK